ncbi:MAG: hypothetical protein U0Q10_08750 [Dermatophilaceae bacterium]
MSGFLRAVKVILAGGLVLVVGAYLIVNMASTVAAAHKRSVINHDLTARLASAVPAARTQLADVRAAGAGRRRVRGHALPDARPGLHQGDSRDHRRLRAATRR